MILKSKKTSKMAMKITPTVRRKLFRKQWARKNWQPLARANKKAKTRKPKSMAVVKLAARDLRAPSWERSNLSPHWRPWNFWIQKRWITKASTAFPRSAASNQMTLTLKNPMCNQDQIGRLLHNPYAQASRSIKSVAAYFVSQTMMEVEKCWARVLNLGRTGPRTLICRMPIRIRMMISNFPTSWATSTATHKLEISKSYQRHRSQSLAIM